MKIYTLKSGEPPKTYSWTAWDDSRPWLNGYGSSEEEAVENLLPSVFEEWYHNTHGRWPLDDDYPDGWDEFKSTVDVVRIA